MMVNNIGPRAAHGTGEMCNPFTVFTKLYHVSSNGMVKVFYLYNICDLHLWYRSTMVPLIMKKKICEAEAQSTQF